MAWYCFHQEQFGEAKWQLILASCRAEVESTGSKLTTALDLDRDVRDKAVSPEDVHYRGDFYMDFDGEDIRDCIRDVQQVLERLRDEFHVNLNCVRVYATGGRGFHLYVPMGIFLDRISPAGYKYLPIIYREMANTLRADTTDLRIYSMKQGRMMRVPNAQRENGKYKVPLGINEVFDLDPESYARVCSAPRPSPAILDPQFSPDLSLLFCQCRDRVDTGVKNKKAKKRDKALLDKFKGETPPTIGKVLNGEALKSDVGFNQLALQLAIIAHEMGWTADDLTERAKGLCRHHVSDSERYNTFQKRQRELARMWYVVDSNPCYDFSVGAVLDLMEGERTQFSDLSDIEQTDLNAKGEPELSITLGLSVNRMGIFLRTEDGKKKICSIGFENVSRFIDLKTHEVLGYIVDVYLDGNLLAERKRLTMDYFASRSRFLGFCLQFGVGSHLTDYHVSALADVMRRSMANCVEKTMIYALTHEGIDYIRLPDGRMDVVFISKDGIHTRLGQPYIYRNAWGKGEDMVFNSDILESPMMRRADGQMTPGRTYLSPEEMVEAKAFFYNLLRINSRLNVAKLIGWFISGFVAPIIRHHFHTFPHLQVYGTSGSGKTTTVRTLSHLHYYHRPPKKFAAAGSTALPFQMAATGTASLPFIMDEYKPAEMPIALTDRLRNLFRSGYDGDEIAKGSIDRDRGEGRLISIEHKIVSPIVFLAEAMESQKAIVERCIVVPIKEQGRDEGAKHMAFCVPRTHYLSAFGHSLLGQVVYGLDVDWLVQQLRDDMATIHKYMSGKQGDRVIFNHAVAVLGLRLLQDQLRLYFGNDFDADVGDLITLILAPSDMTAQAVAPLIKSELVQVLSEMSFLSRYSDAADDHRILLGKDYDIGENYVDIHYQKCFLKYQKHCKSHGERPLFQSAESFRAALENFAGAAPAYNDLLSSSGRGVYRLDYHTLHNVEGIESFNGV